MKELLKANRYFLFPFLIFALVCSILLISFSKADLHIFLNKANHPVSDTFFKYATWLGDGAWIAVVFIALLFVRYRYALAFLTGSLATSLLVNLIKKVILSDVYRPSKYFELFETYKLHLVEGVKLHSLQSFPSGHSATAFNLFLTLAVLSKNNLLKLVCFLAAMLVACSRVYLSQHFLADILAGSVIAVVLILISFAWFGKMNNNWLNKSLLWIKK